MTIQWEGATVATFGDSITWYDGNAFYPSHVEFGQTAVGYQSYIRSELGATTLNRGQSGQQMPGVLEIIQATNLAGVDAVTITAGANDFRLSPNSVGTIAAIGATFNTGKFYGALQAAIEHITSTYPSIQIFLITPIKGWNDATGLMPETYPQAFVNVGALYGIPVCDWYHDSGIDPDATGSVYIGDKPEYDYYLHPTNAGFERMADVLIPFLRRQGRTRRGASVGAFL